MNFIKIGVPLVVTGFVVLGVFIFGRPSDRASATIINIANLRGVNHEIQEFRRERGRWPNSIYELPGYRFDVRGGFYQYRTDAGTRCDWVLIAGASEGEAQDHNKIIAVSPIVEATKSGRGRIVMYANGHVEVVEAQAGKWGRL